MFISHLDVDMIIFKFFRYSLNLLKICVFNLLPQQEVTLVKSGGPLGLSIVGGSDHASHPFGINEPGVFISKVKTLSTCSALYAQNNGYI